MFCREGPAHPPAAMGPPGPRCPLQLGCTSQAGRVIFWGQLVAKVTVALCWSTDRESGDSLAPTPGPGTPAGGDPAVLRCHMCTECARAQPGCHRLGKPCARLFHPPCQQRAFLVPGSCRLSRKAFSYGHRHGLSLRRHSAELGDRSHAGNKSNLQEINQISIPRGLQPTSSASGPLGPPCLPPPPPCTPQAVGLHPDK